MQCDEGLADIVDSLIRRGANVNAKKSERRMPLHLAISHGYTAVVTVCTRKTTGTTCSSRRRWCRRRRRVRCSTFLDIGRTGHWRARASLS